MWTDSPLLRDAAAAVLTGCAALAVLRFWEELANRALLEQKLSRKLVHISVGLIFFLLWPLFSSDMYAPFLAALAPGINTVRLLLLGLGIMKNDAVVKSMTRHGGYRELLKGPLYYACAITLTTVIFWRTSPISIAGMCNLSAGDGVADIAGRHFGRAKLAHNPDKSYAGSLAMFFAGFITSVCYMYYFNLFGFVGESWSMVLGFAVVSLAAAIVESLPVSTKLDDNLTVPLASLLAAAVVFHFMGVKNLCCMISSGSSSAPVTVQLVLASGR